MDTKSFAKGTICSWKVEVRVHCLVNSIWILLFYLDWAWRISTPAVSRCLGWWWPTGATLGPFQLQSNKGAPNHPHFNF